MRNDDISEIVKRLVKPPRTIPKEMQAIQMSADYGMAIREYRISHREPAGKDRIANWIARYMRRHYGYQMIKDVN